MMFKWRFALIRQFSKAPFVEHDVRVFGLIVHVFSYFRPSATGERVSEVSVFSYPFAQFDHGGFFRGEIDERLVLQDGEYVEVIGQFPAHVVCADFGGQIRRVDQEDDSGKVFVAGEQFLVVAACDDKPVQITGAQRIVRRPNIVVKGLLFHLVQVQTVFHGEHQRRREGDVVDIPVFFFPGDESDYLFPGFSGNAFMPLYVRCGLPYVCQQGVCAGYGFESVAVVVEIVVDDRRVGPLMLGDVR